MFSGKFIENIFFNPGLSSKPKATDRSPAYTTLIHCKVESPMTQGKIAEGWRIKHGMVLTKILWVCSTIALNNVINTAFAVLFHI